jgi:hypothetical protein
MFRSSTRGEQARRERGDLEHSQARRAGASRRRRRAAAVERRARPTSSTKRRERDDADVEVELGDVVEQPAQHGPTW